MATCVECGTENDLQARFCSSCGQPTSSVSQFATAMAPSARAAAPVRAEDQAKVDRFSPGTILATRYRIVALLGRGGMGEVYRADDLKLGHAVALKFLPPALEKDVALLDRFHAEVRNARQISHPNVCRVYDIGEIDGRHYFTMEYIDGEDLASLLRRIGRLPHDKAVELAHQFCAGLAAAHDNGLLHRDLKPANIMIDGRGRARITDFGLALRADDAGGAREFAGTPAYMAPEQLSGGAASVRSDIYALGLILYEMFTGKRPFEGESRADWTRVHIENTPRIPTTITDVNPAVERAIMRCLAKDPAMRPSSAQKVSASLPGGDPLAAAMAAGETPSPEMVAAAGKETGISVRNAVLLFVAALVLMAILVPLARRSMLLGVAPLTKSPDVLADRAHDLIQQLGYTDEPADTYGWFETDSTYLTYKAKHEPAPERVRNLRSAWPGPYRFWYRQSPDVLAANNIVAQITMNDPPMDRPGMVTVVLNGSGNLTHLRAVPPRFEAKESTPPPAPDWPALFTAAGLNIADFHTAPAVLVPPYAFDSRASWQGIRDGIPVNIDAAAYRGKPIYFGIAFPWTPRESASSAANQYNGADVAQFIVSILFLLLLPALGVFMARRNIRSGRGDTAAAWRIALFVMVCYVARQAFTLHYFSGPRMLNAVLVTISIALFLGAVMWASYMALEPMVRRQSPHLAISWARLISGRFTDPLVGRDLLIGCVAGLFLCILGRIPNAMPYWRNVKAMMPEEPLSTAISGTGPFIGQFFNGSWNALFVTLTFLFILTLGHALFRGKWGGVAVLWLVVGGLDLLRLQNAAVEIVPTLLGGLVTVAILVWIGPVALAALLATQMLVSNLTFALDASTWYAPRSAFSIVLALAIAAYGFRCALAGRPLFASGDSTERSEAASAY